MTDEGYHTDSVAR